MPAALDAPATVPILNPIRTTRGSSSAAASGGTSGGRTGGQSMYSDQHEAGRGQVSPNWLNFFGGVSFAAFNPVENIDPLSITGTMIANNAISTPKIVVGAVTADRISVATLSAISADMGHLTAGDIVLPSGGFIRSGQTAYDTGTGFYLGNDSGTPKFSIGNSAGDKLTWDGSTLAITGDIVAADITGGTITGSSFMTAGSGNNRVTIDSTNGLQLIDSGDVTRVQLNASVYAGMLLNGIRSIDTNSVFMESQSQNVQFFVDQASARASFAITGSTRGYIDDQDTSGGGNLATSAVFRVNGALHRLGCQQGTGPGLGYAYII